MSAASYVCSEDYRPNVTPSVRVCRDSGEWSGTTIACGEQLVLASIMWLVMVCLVLLASIVWI